MTPRKKKKKSARARGGQPANKNALKHGFYSKRFTASEKKSLDEVDIDVIESQINLLQVAIDRLIEITQIKIETYIDNAGNEQIRDHYLHQLNTVTAMSLAVGTHYRTSLLASGKTGEADLAIMEAIKQVQIEMGIE